MIAFFFQVMSIIEREQTQLEVQFQEEETQAERCFIEQAMELLKDRAGNLESTVAPAVALELKENVSVDGVIENDVMLAQVDENVDIKNSDVNTSSKYFYFYQGKYVDY